jgi:hypothetical protein
MKARTAVPAATEGKVSSPAQVKANVTMADLVGAIEEQAERADQTRRRKQADDVTPGNCS